MLDISSFYDNAWKPGLLHQLWNAGIQGGAFLIFCSYFEATRMSIVVEGVASDEWTSNLGILEGSVLAILLAALYLTGLVQYRTRRRRRSLVGRQWDHSVHKRALL